MKKVFYFFAVSLMMIFAASCEKETVNGGTDDDLKLLNVNVQLKFQETVPGLSLNELPVTMTKGETVFNGKTNEAGVATFNVPSGIYDVTCSSKQAAEGKFYLLNGSYTRIVVSDTPEHPWDENKPIEVELVSSKTSQIIIKEIYTGGTYNVNTTKNEAFDKYITIYNNSPLQANLKNLCIGNTQGNAHIGLGSFTDNSGKLTYADEDWIPNTHAVIYFPHEVVIEPYSEIVVVLNAAIDHTLTNPASLDLSHADYVLYDPESGFNHRKYHPAPSKEIPSDHYLKAIRYGLGNSWMISMFTPAFFLYSLEEGITPEAYANDTSIDIYPPSLENSQAFLSKKLKRSLIYDGVDTEAIDYDDNYKRFTPDIDAGFVYYIIAEGYSLYRNVDVEATEAIEGNKDKLVRNYALGTDNIEKGSTDPSGIDAEASIKNGAKIVYMDTNNSTADFHMRKKAAQKK